jgi:hypothetical protein
MVHCNTAVVAELAIHWHEEQQISHGTFVHPCPFGPLETRLASASISSQRQRLCYMTGSTLLQNQAIF